MMCNWRMAKKPLTRSEIMSRIRSKNTKPEIFVRKLLYGAGVRYRVHYRELPGKPDIYVSKYRTAIFVNGCFWHMHDGCRYARFPQSNTEYWNAKLTRNKERDQAHYADLKDAGIDVIVLWECTLKKLKNDEDAARLCRELISLIQSGNVSYREIDWREEAENSR